MSKKIKDAVLDAVEGKALEQGHLTGQQFLELLEEQQSTLKEFVVSWLDKLNDLIVQIYLNSNNTNEENDDNSNNDAAHVFAVDDEEGDANPNVNNIV